MSIRITVPGPLSSLQDLGRFGYQASGFSPSGAMDTDALRTLNCLLGNGSGEAAVEMTAGGISGEFDCDCFFALTGADNVPTLNGTALSVGRVYEAHAGDVLACGYAQNGIRTYFGVAGGFDIPVVMGSRSTGMKFSVGGYLGRKLASGDVLEFRNPSVVLKKTEKRVVPPKCYADTAVLRVVPGPQDDRFSPEALRSFYTTVYTVSNAMDRMGIRLEGESVPALNGYDIISDATATGSVQITNDGKPIILLADRQTTGGYTKIATVITADLSVAGQLKPGCKIQFQPISAEKARKCWLKLLKAYKKADRRLNGRR